MTSHVDMERNFSLYESFWEEVPDFARYNPGARHRRRLVMAALRAESFTSLLDVGCGNGELLATIAREYPNLEVVAGADLAPTQIARNEVRFPKVQFYTLDIEKNALDRTFARVVCSEVVEHLQAQEAGVRHLAAMVAPGGRLVITCPAGTMYATERHFGHVRHPTKDDLVRYAEAAGLRLVSMRNWGFPFYRALKWATNVNSEWALRSFGSTRYSRAAKAISTGLYWFNYLNFPDDARGCQIVATFEKRV
jgi:cyclopropane fatty-acyl-phospholipid synthase-like methyltransferase